MMLSVSASAPAPKMLSAARPAAAIVPALVMPPIGISTPSVPVISAVDVKGLLDTAEEASIDRNAIIVVVDRSGNILGVRVESGVPIVDQTTMVFAIDGAVSLARTGAFFASGGDPSVPSGAPLTSRTVQFISQSTITQREVQSSPDIGNTNSPLSGPGYVAPIGIGNHFPPGVMNAPQVDLFGIEQTNRGINIPTSDLAIDPSTGLPVALPNTESYGQVTGLLPTAQSRGIATLPGGIPLYKNGALVGGIGVFFPGPNGYASYEQNFQPVTNPKNEIAAEMSRINAPMVLEAEWMAFAAAGGTRVASPQLRSLLLPVTSVAGYGLPLGYLSLVGVTLDVFGPMGPVQGRLSLINTSKRVKAFSPAAMNTAQISADLANPSDPNALDAPGKYHVGITPPSGWLVAPHSSAFAGGLTAAQVTQIVDQGVTQAATTRAAIRLQLPSLSNSTTASYVFAVADEDGSILGLYRMPDATIFSIDVAVAKARNTVYYASSSLQASDKIYNIVNKMPVGPALIPAGVAFTNRTFRALAEPHFPGGIDTAAPGPFSSLNAPGINPLTAENLGPALPASVYRQSTTPDYMYTSFMVGANFHDPNNKAKQNGVVWFPGSSPLYKGTVAAPLLVGGFGTSGDGVDQDDVATVAGQQGYAAPAMIRADQYLVHGVRLPYQKFNRNPSGGIVP